ncbi:glycosyltransferase family 2 protein [Planctomicrobium sp. SH527]|uniref:glycosyltransferase family 2 protein n=1 Tax=Planctomicrobium sp. SH527 TaxID=3448123 RepID=UPI003F5BA6A2
MSQQIAISVIIPQHSRCELTVQAVSTLALHHHASAMQIIVVDDGSPAAEIALFQQQCPAGVTIIRQSQRRGVTAAWNLGASAAAANTLVFLNNDTITTGEWLTSISQALTQVQSRSGGSALKLVGVQSRTSSEVLRIRPLNSSIKRPRTLLQGWCLAMHRRTFEALDGFDERFCLYYSDTDLQLRCLETWPQSIGVIHGLPVRHLGRKSTRCWARRNVDWKSDKAKFYSKWKAN